MPGLPRNCNKSVRQAGFAYRIRQHFVPAQGARQASTPGSKARQGARQGTLLRKRTIDASDRDSSSFEEHWFPSILITCWVLPTRLVLVYFTSIYFLYWLLYHLQTWRLPSYRNLPTFLWIRYSYVEYWTLFEDRTLSAEPLLMMSTHTHPVDFLRHCIYMYNINI